MNQNMQMTYLDKVLHVELEKDHNVSNTHFLV